jgi:hypothetical protein
MAGTEFPSGPDGAFVDEPGVVTGIPSAATPGAQYYLVAGGIIDTQAGLYHGSLTHSDPFSARSPTEADLGLAASDLIGSFAWWSINAETTSARRAFGSVWTYLTNDGIGQTSNSGMTTVALLDGVPASEELGVVTYLVGGNLGVIWSFQGFLVSDPDSFLDTGLTYPIAEWIKTEATVSAPARSVQITVSTEAGVYWSGSVVLPATLPGLMPGDPDRTYSLQSVSHMTARADYFTGYGGFPAYALYVDDLFATFDPPPLRKYRRFDGRGMSQVARGRPNPAPRLYRGQP